MDLLKFFRKETTVSTPNPTTPPPPSEALLGTVECSICKRTMDEHGSKDCHGHMIEGLKSLPISKATAKL